MRILKAFLLISIILTYGCCNDENQHNIKGYNYPTNTPLNHEYQSHVSDTESEPKIKGITYNKGQQQNKLLVKLINWVSHDKNFKVQKDE